MMKRKAVLIFLIGAISLGVHAQSPIYTLAGNGRSGKSDGKDTTARFNAPAGFCVSPDGQFLYVADFYNNQIRRIEIATHKVITIAGEAEGFSDGLGKKAKFALPYDICISPDGKFLFVSDWYNCRIRKLELNADTSGMAKVSTLAGSGQTALRDGRGTGASFFKPSGICISPDGKFLYLSDQFNNAIRQINTATADVITLVGGTFGSKNGIGKSAQFKGPSGICISSDGKFLFVCDKGNHNIRKIEIATKTVSVIAGNVQGFFGFQDGTPDTSRFDNPNGICFSADEKYLYVTDMNNQRLRQVEVATGIVWTIAGMGSQGYSNFSIMNSMFRNPNFIRISPGGKEIYFTDRDNHCVRVIQAEYIRPIQLSAPKTFVEATVLQKKPAKVNPKIPSKVFTLAGNGAQGNLDGKSKDAEFNAPAGICASPLYGKYLYISDFYNNTVRRLNMKTREVTTIAGGEQGFGDGEGTSAKFALPYGICASPDGKKLYVADWYNCKIRIVNFNLESDSQQVASVTTLAGGSTTALRDGTGEEALFYKPAGICISPDGKILYVADQFNNAVRKIDIDSRYVSTLAGGKEGFVDGTGEVAKFKGPSGICISPDGKTLYVSDKGNHGIRKIDIDTRTVTTLAGNASGFYGFQDGEAKSARFSSPNGLAINADAKYLYVADFDNERIRKIDLATGKVSTFAGSGDAGMDNLSYATSTFRFPNLLAISPNGYALYVTDRDNHSVRMIEIKPGLSYTEPPKVIPPKTTTTTTTQTLANNQNKKENDKKNDTKNTTTTTPTIKKPAYTNTAVKMVTIAGTGEMGDREGAGEKANFNMPGGICLSPKGQYLYIADTYNHRICKFDIAGKEVITIAGGKEGYEDGEGTKAKFLYPYGICISPDGKKLYVSEGGNNRIRKIVLGSNNDATVTTLAGNGEAGLKEGIGTMASFSLPAGLCISPDGKYLYLADQKNNAVRMIETVNGKTTTVAGGGVDGRADGAGVVARFKNPTGICISPDGKILYVADRGNYTIRKIEIETKTVTTICGEAGQYSYVDRPGLSSRFNVPSGICITPDGEYLYVADSKNNRIRVIHTNTLEVSTYAGNGQAGLINSTLGKSSFRYPNFICISQKGTELYISEQDNHTIRQIKIPMVAVP